MTLSNSSKQVNKSIRVLPLWVEGSSWNYAERFGINSIAGDSAMKISYGSFVYLLCLANTFYSQCNKYLQFTTNFQEKISGNRNCSIIMCFRYFWYLLTRRLLKSQHKRMTRVKPKITWVCSDDAVAPSRISNSFRYHHAQKQQLEKQLFWPWKNYTVLTACGDVSECFPLSPISLEGIPKNPQVQSLLSWVASMFWKARKNVWAFPGVLLKERAIIAAFVLVRDV